VSELTRVTLALTQAQRDRIYDHYTGINEGWHGAGVADILEILFQADAHMEILEPFFGKHTNELPWTPAVNYAAYALVGMGEELSVERIKVILERMP
jgi:hypothetical protein